jgi:hypothetical protein
MNNLGIFSGGFPQGPIRPGLFMFRARPIVRAIQLANSQRRGGVVNTNNIGSTPLRLTVSGTSTQITTAADGTVIITGMTLTWPINSNARATFDANYRVVGDLIDITAEAAADTNALAAELAALPGGVLHGAVFGNGETLLPGVYDVVTAADIQGILTLDGGGDPNSLFVVRVNGALTSVAASQVILTNGANAANIFWSSQGATALGANSIFEGTALADGAASIGDGGIGIGGSINGRLLSTLGAVNTDTNIVTQPGATTTSITLGVLELFALFTAGGAVANTGTSEIHGNIGTDVGAISGYGSPTIVDGNVYIPGSLAAGPVSANFGIYVNGVLVPSTLITVSSPTSIPVSTMTTSATVPLLIGDVVTAKSTVTEGTLRVTNRTLTLLQVP